VKFAGVALFVLTAAVASSALPLLVYTTTLALFGLAHVVVELRYVDARFGRRAARELWLGAALLLGAVVVVRALRIAGLLAQSHPPIEVALVAALAVLALPALSRSGGLPLLAGVVVVAALLAGAVTAPALTLVLLAVVHNATPIGFLVEAAAADARKRTLAWSLLAFVGAPLVVASGLPREALMLLGLHLPDASLLPAGSLATHLGVYVPQSLLAWDGAVDAFSAVVCAQVLHYAAVIVLLPRRLAPTDRPLLPWPRRSMLLTVLVVAGAGLFVHFALRFQEARALYGLAAAVHAWIEVPVLLWATAAHNSRPTPNDSALATNASNSARGAVTAIR
jgi:hypothetical protein